MYFGALLKTPLDHCVILSGDLDNIKAQADLDSYNSNKLDVRINHSTQNFRHWLALSLGIKSKIRSSYLTFGPTETDFY
jgi:hypothetical protein